MKTLLIALALTTTAAATDLNRVQRAASNHIVRIESGSGQSTGSHIGNGRILTVAHATRHGGPYRVTFPSGRRYAAKVHRRDMARDIAVLTVGKDLGPGLTLAGDARIRSGQIVGYPGGGPLSHVYTKSQVDETGRPVRLMDQTGTVPSISLIAGSVPGLSGAPLLDDRGRIAAVIWGGLDHAAASDVSAFRVQLTQWCPPPPPVQCLPTAPPVQYHAPVVRQQLRLEPPRTTTPEIAAQTPPPAKPANDTNDESGRDRNDERMHRLESSIERLTKLIERDRELTRDRLNQLDSDIQSAMMVKSPPVAATPPDVPAARPTPAYFEIVPTSRAN